MSSFPLVGKTEFYWITCHTCCYYEIKFLFFPLTAPSSPVHNRRLLGGSAGGSRTHLAATGFAGSRMSSIDLPDEADKSSASNSPCPSPVREKSSPICQMKNVSFSSAERQSNAFFASKLGEAEKKETKTWRLIALSKGIAPLQLTFWVRKVEEPCQPHFLRLSTWLLIPSQLNLTKSQERKSSKSFHFIPVSYKY